MDPNGVLPVRVNYIEPFFTFGVELETTYLFHRAHIQNFVNGPYNGPLRQRYIAQYVASILMHSVPNDPALFPSGLGMVYAPARRITYHNWVVVKAESARATAAEIRGVSNAAPDAPLDVVDWQGVEVSSPMFRYVDDDTWLRSLSQIEHDLGNRLGVGMALNNDTAGLRLHFALRRSRHAAPLDVSLELAQNLVMFWTICEEHIESLHPQHRRSGFNTSAQSLRHRFPAPEWSLRDFAEVVYDAPSIAELSRVLAPGGGPRKLKVYFSPPNDLMETTTIMFREHRGTQNAEEIAWWIVFCTRSLSYVYEITSRLLTFIQVHGNIPQDLRSLEHIFEALELEQEGRAFFRRQARKWRAEAEGRPISDSGDDDDGDGFDDSDYSVGFGGIGDDHEPDDSDDDDESRDGDDEDESRDSEDEDESSDDDESVGGPPDPEPDAGLAIDEVSAPRIRRVQRHAGRIRGSFPYPHTYAERQEHIRARHERLARERMR